MSSPLSAPSTHRRAINRLAGAAVEQARLTVVVPRVRSGAPRVPFVALITAILLGGVVGLLLFNTSMQQASFAATSLERQASSLSAREQQLRMELEQLRDPQNLAAAARKVGMVPPPPPCFLHLGSGRIEGNCSAADPAADLDIAPRPPRRPAVLDPKPINVDPTPPADSRGPGRGDRDQPPGTDRTEVPSNLRDNWIPQQR